MITLYQLSDLHFASRSRGERQYQPEQHRSPASSGNVSNRGHDRRVAYQLSLNWRRHVEKHAEIKSSVVVTGDITRSGKGFQYGLAHRFLLSIWSEEPQDIGMDCGSQQLFCVPGKYDLHPPKFPNERIIRAHFGRYPMVRTITDSTKTFAVQLIGLDSCSGVLEQPVNQLGISDGAFPADHLQKAERKLKATKIPMLPHIRIAVMHVPPVKFAAATLAEFNNWAKRNRVQAVFSGFEHNGQVYDDNSTPKWRRYVDFRCGTTLMAGTKNHLPGPQPNHFRFHCLQGIEGEAAVNWSCLDYYHNGISWGSPAQSFKRELHLS